MSVGTEASQGRIRLSGEQIPVEARIFALVDVWDALRSDRPYRRAWSVEETWKQIKSLSGSHFDPKVVDCLLNVIRFGPKFQNCKTNFVTFSRISVMYIRGHR